MTQKSKNQDLTENEPNTFMAPRPPKTNKKMKIVVGLVGAMVAVLAALAVTGLLKL